MGTSVALQLLNVAFFDPSRPKEAILPFFVLVVPLPNRWVSAT